MIGCGGATRGRRRDRGARGRGVKGGGGAEVAREGINEEGGVVVGVEGD